MSKPLSSASSSAPSGEGYDSHVYLTPAEACAYLKVSRAVLRRTGMGIAVSARKTIYRKADLDDWMEARVGGGVIDDTTR